MPQPTLTIITANQRLATDYCQRQALASPGTSDLDCLPLNRWLERSYRELQLPETLLSEFQALACWEQIIADDCRDTQPGLFHSRSLARMAYQAWKALLTWQIPLRVLAQNPTPEVTAFHRWANAFQEYCTQRHCVDQAMAAGKVLTALSARQLALPQHIVLIGFIETPPQMQAIFDALAAQCQLRHEDVSLTAQCQRVRVSNEEEEWRAMVHWACQTWQENPQLCIGCVVPKLEQVRDDITRLFTHAQNDLPSPPAHLVNIAGGDSFSRFPLIQMALEILQLTTNPISTTALSRLFCSPFIGGAEQELIERSQLDVQLREYREAFFEWPVLLTWLRQAGICADLVARCEAYIVAKPANTQLAPSAWAEYFTKQLDILGWPGERGLNSAEFQQQERWRQLLQEFSGLDSVFEKPLSLTQALRELHILTQETPFQPQTPATPIQVLGVLDAVGLKFDRLWICGMTQEDWPPAPAPNPFLPVRLQRQHRMPHASAERELLFSQQVIHYLQHSTQQLIFSYASLKEDRPQAPSRLITHVDTVPLSQLIDGSFISQPQPAALEYIIDEQAPALTDPAAFRANASLFKQQAACPFNAFATFRLGATALPSSEPHLTAQERGIHLHSVLENVWSVLRDHDTLVQYEPTALRELIASKVNEVLTRYAKRRHFALQPQLLKLEQQRLTDIVQRWLSFEKQRPRFKVVNIETRRSIEFAGLNFTLRIDREDELANGTRILIDYKTGNCYVNAWFGERPDDPQLPLYGITGTPQAEGLMFAQVSTQTMQFKGVSASECDIAGMITIDQQGYDPTLPSWEDFYQQQSVVLTQLTEEFKQGNARVDPKHGYLTCQYCDLQALCRVGQKHNLKT